MEKELTKKGKRINIMGAAPGWEHTPFKNGEVWAVNDTHRRRDVDLMVDIHDRRNPKEEHDKISLAELKERGTPAYTQYLMDGFPNVKKYPIKEIKQEFDTDYFGSGIDYMIALAIYQGASEIHLYGIIMAKGSEYSHQKPSVEFWLGIAKGRGVKVRIHGYYSAILKTKNFLMYGYQVPQDFTKKYHPDQVELLEMLKNYEE